MAEFLNCETFPFGVGKAQYACRNNSVTIGRGPNGKWAFGLDLATPKSIRCNGLSVYCTPYDTRLECLYAALSEFIDWHVEQEDKFSKQLLNEAHVLRSALRYTGVVAATSKRLVKTEQPADKKYTGATVTVFALRIKTTS